MMYSTSKERYHGHITEAKRLRMSIAGWKRCYKRSGNSTFRRVAIDRILLRLLMEHRSCLIDAKLERTTTHYTL